MILLENADVMLRDSIVYIKRSGKPVDIIGLLAEKVDDSSAVGASA